MNNYGVFSEHTMTYLDAAYTILKTAGRPLHFDDITQRALAQKLIAPQGLTPDATMASRLYTDTKQPDSRFVRAGHGRFGLVQWQPKGIDAHVDDINATTRAQLAQLIGTMPPARFEALVRELLIQMGFDESTVNLTPYTNDQGIDVAGTYRAAGLTDISAAVQVKRWKGNVGAPIVTQLRGSLQVHQQGIIITTSDFSKSAREEAAAPNKTRIGLINASELIGLLIRHQVGVVKRTLEVTTLDEEYWGELAGQANPPETTFAAVIEPAARPPAAAKPAAPKTAPPPAVAEKQQPTGYTLLGQPHTASSWRAILIGTCATLAQQHGVAFGPAAMALKGRTRQYVAATPNAMNAPASIPGTDLWVETNQSATSTRRLLDKLLGALGHRPTDLTVT